MKNNQGEYNKKMYSTTVNSIETDSDRWIKNTNEWKSKLMLHTVK